MHIQIIACLLLAAYSVRSIICIGYKSAGFISTSLPPTNKGTIVLVGKFFFNKCLVPKKNILFSKKYVDFIVHNPSVVVIYYTNKLTPTQVESTYVSYYERTFDYLGKLGVGRRPMARSACSYM